MKKSDYRQQIEDMSAERNEMLQRIDELVDELETAKGAIKDSFIAFDKMCTNYENQLKIQDKELARRLILIHYLEDRLNEIIKANS